MLGPGFNVDVVAVIVIMTSISWLLLVDGEERKWPVRLVNFTGGRHEVCVDGLCSDAQQELPWELGGSCHKWLGLL